MVAIVVDGEGAGVVRRGPRRAEHAARRVERGHRVVPQRVADPTQRSASSSRRGRDAAIVLSFGLPERPRDAASRTAAEWSAARTGGRSRTSSGGSHDDRAPRRRPRPRRHEDPGGRHRSGRRRCSARRDATPARGGPEAVVAELARPSARRATAGGRRRRSCVVSASGAPGAIDVAAGASRGANIDGWDGPFPLGPMFAAELGVPVAVGNDVNVAVDAERRYGAGRAFAASSVSSGAPGSGGGIVVDGQAASGPRSAGEIGHVCARPGGRVQLWLPRVRRGVRRARRAGGAGRARRSGRPCSSSSSASAVATG